MKNLRELLNVILILLAVLAMACFVFLILPFVQTRAWIWHRYIEKCDKCGKRGRIRYVALCHFDDIPAGKTIKDATLKICPRCQP